MVTRAKVVFECDWGQGGEGDGSPEDRCLYPLEWYSVDDGRGEP